jgi:hypothetical protein
VDLALRTDGRWRVVEIGDGQVSDYPAGYPAAALIEALNLHHVQAKAGTHDWTTPSTTPCTT